jgi:hypothetical protein
VLFEFHPITAEIDVMVVAEIFVGFGHVAAGSHDTSAIQPALTITLSLLKRKVKQPSELDEVNGPGIVVPQKAPGNPPGILFPLLPLEICVAEVEFPSKTYNPSQIASTSNEVKVTVTTSPGVVGQMI